MGQGTGKEHNHDGDEERVYDTRKIYYDDVGNICYGKIIARFFRFQMKKQNSGHLL